MSKYDLESLSKRASKKLTRQQHGSKNRSNTNNLPRHQRALVDHTTILYDTKSPVNKRNVHIKESKTGLDNHGLGVAILEHPRWHVIASLLLALFMVSITHIPLSYYELMKEAN